MTYPCERCNMDDGSPVCLQDERCPSKRPALERTELWKCDDCGHTGDGAAARQRATAAPAVPRCRTPRKTAARNVAPRTACSLPAPNAAAGIGSMTSAASRPTYRMRGRAGLPAKVPLDPPVKPHLVKV